MHLISSAETVMSLLLFLNLSIGHYWWLTSHKRIELFYGLCMCVSCYLQNHALQLLSFADKETTLIAEEVSHMSLVVRKLVFGGV